MRDAEYYGQLRHEPGEYDMLLRCGRRRRRRTAPHSSAAPPEDGAYFVVPENAQLGDYWTRVEDRLRKIRQSLDILGVGRPLPLFEPPIDPAALVAGGRVRGWTSRRPRRPARRWRSRTTASRSCSAGPRTSCSGWASSAATCSSVLERRDAEELTLLQSRHEGAILALTRAIKEDQVGIARANLAELAESEAAARNRQTHYQRLLDQGMSPLEQAQVGLMISASAAHHVAAALKLGAGIAHAFPQSKIGPFIMGIETGGDQAGSSLDKFSEFSESLGEGLSVTGEVLGIFASHQRMAGGLASCSSAPARSDLAQIAQQIAGGDPAGGRRRARPGDPEQQIAHNESVTTFLTGKFAGAQLYQWMSGRLSAALPAGVRHGLRAWPGPPSARSSSSGASTRPTRASSGRCTGTSRRNGLLAGEALGLDLERMATAYQDADSRGLEITKRISLAELDPVALLRLKARRHVRVHALRGAVRLRLPRPLPAPDPVASRSTSPTPTASRPRRTRS